MSTGLTSESLESAAQEGVPGSSDSIGKSGHCLLSCDQSRGEGNRVEESRGTCYVHDEDDEEEDVDFNPFAKSDSAEASSSLSSEVEDLDINENGNNREKCEGAHDEIFEEKHVLGARECSSSIGGNISVSEEIIVRPNFPSEDYCGIQNEEAFPATAEDGQLLISNKEIFSLSDDCNGTVHQMDSTCAADDGKASADVDGDGAICMRTRARYSLAQFTLDELETFLQETDDEEDLHRVDDEEEYKKFLAAVLRGDELQNAPENSNGDDEDEENDADFELELEEALESEPEDVEQRRMTRLNKRQKTSREHGKKVSHHAGRQLRPLIPLSLSSYPFTEGSQLAPNIAQPFVPPGNNSVCGFTPLQIGQLHCLIHEHVQLLIQVFSVCVFEPVKSHIAAEVKELISEMLRIREQAMTWKKVPFPSFCFFPPYVHPSVTDEDPRMLQPNCSYRNLIQDVPSGSNKDVSSNFSSMSSEKCVGLPGEHASFPRNPESTSWTPYVCGPVLSVLDVAPLRLVENYADDVTSVVRAHKRCQIERGFENQCQSEPLFPYPSNSGYAESDSQGEIENNNVESNELRSSSSGSDMPKKTMAAALLKKAKSQPVSLVPKDIAKLAQRFGPLFNPALYPHKPPPAPLANRVLFTDAEDELLALGLMEFNTDWKAIQQRFLPCKSTHQIFVRQKNRASSKAPENPIKVVRRMKNSPLTSEEIARIEVGLKKFKLDWMSIWRFIVPYRDPSILPRQWRIASGTQKSYKSDANKKAKRLLYEMRRKASKTSSLSAHSPLRKKGYATDNGTGEASCWSKHIAKEDEAYVHEAFLADWRPDSDLPPVLQAAMHSEESCQALSMIDNSEFGTNQTQPNPSTSSAHVYLRPYRARRQNTARVVKLAPDLPPVNLPPSVRIISQSAFKRNQTSVCAGVFGNSSRVEAAEKTPCFANHFVAAASQHGNGDTIFEKHISETNGADLQMHPLLFQSSQGAAQLPYHSVNCGSTFISGKQPQLALSLFHNPRQIKDAVSFLGKCAPTSGGVFHPLLQRNDAADTKAMVSQQATRTSSDRRFGLVENSPASTSKQAREGYSSSSALGMKAISPNRRNNQLDLDIHLSVTSKNQQSAQGRDTATCHSSHRSSGAFEAEAAEDSTKEGRMRSEVDTGYFEQDRAVSHRMDDASFPDIIMEQEELSDSEEEFEENIEFECEEMVDSEPDGTSDSEQLANTPNEEMLVEEIDEVNAKKQVHNA